MDSRPHRPEGTAGDGGDIFIRHLFEKAENEHLAMLGCQTIECAMNRLGVLGREISAAVKLAVRLAIVDRSSGRNVLAQIANCPVASDPVEPGLDGARIAQSRN